MCKTESCMVRMGSGYLWPFSAHIVRIYTVSLNSGYWVRLWMGIALCPVPGSPFSLLLVWAGWLGSGHETIELEPQQGKEPFPFHLAYIVISASVVIDRRRILAKWTKLVVAQHPGNATSESSACAIVCTFNLAAPSFEDEAASTVTQLFCALHYTLH